MRLVTSFIQNKAHFFAAYERTQQDTKQAVNTQGLFPEFDGVYDTPSRENLFTAKVSTNLTPSQYLTVRYGWNTNEQVYAAAPKTAPSNWGDSENKFNSINANHNWVIGGSMVNEFVFQYADFSNHITARSIEPLRTFPVVGVAVGANANTPQTTEQHKFQFRDDFSWHLTGKGGLGHDFKAGVNFIHEPRLYVTFSNGSLDYSYTYLNDKPDGPITTITRNKPGSAANLPMDQFGIFFQDDWRVSSRLTINAGLRYDLVTGFDLDQSQIPNFVALTTAARDGRFNSAPGFSEFSRKTGEDTNNVQPRIGAVYDVRGNGKDVIRAGWGIYYDFGYTNANILFPGLSVQGGSGPTSLSAIPKASRTPTVRSSRSAIRSRTSPRETRSSRKDRSTARTWRRLGCVNRGRARRRWAGRTRSRHRRSLMSTTSTSAATILACGGH